eukprot:3678444-Lingulodinium_polyedra.AAC.1
MPTGGGPPACSGLPPGTLGVAAAAGPTSATLLSVRASSSVASSCAGGMGREGRQPRVRVCTCGYGEPLPNHGRCAGCGRRWRGPRSKRGRVAPQLRVDALAGADGSKG